MGSDLGRVGHDVAGVLEGVADVAIRVVGIGSSGIGYVEVPAFAEVGVRDASSGEHVTDVRLRGGWNRERGILEGGAPVAQVARVVIVEQVVGTFRAARADGSAQGF